MAPDVSNLVELIRVRAREPERIAYTFDGEPRTFGAMWQDLNRCAAWLLDSGLKRHECVLMVLPNGHEFFTGFYGAQRAGGIAVPIFPGSGPGRIRDLAALCNAQTILVPSSTPAAQVEQLARMCGRRVVTIEAAQAPFADHDFPAIDPDDLSYLQYTSGSTGLPKGVELTHRNLLTNVLQLIAGMQITEQEIFVSWLPVYHDMGLILKTLVPFYLGTRLILLPTSLKDVHTWLAAVEQHRATYTAAPDFAYRVCLRYIKDPSRYDLRSLRVALNAAEPVRAQTVREFEQAFGLKDVMMPAYGLAEATVGVSMWGPSAPIKVDARGFVSVGRPFPHIQIKILRDEQEVGAGEIGEILIQSPANTRGYFQNPEATANLHWHDGFIRTGDLGYLDAEGFLYIVGRQKNIIIHGGQNLSPREIEEAVDVLPFIRFSAALGIDRGRTEGEQAYVFAELRPEDPRPDELPELAAEIVASVFQRIGIRPGRVYLLRPKAIPLTYNGKTQHTLLKQQYLDGELRSQGLILYPEF